MSYQVSLINLQSLLEVGVPPSVNADNHDFCQMEVLCSDWSGEDHYEITDFMHRVMIIGPIGTNLNLHRGID